MRGAPHAAGEDGDQQSYLEQLGTFSGAVRGPRGWTISIAYYALVPASLINAETSSGLLFERVDQLGNLPFDHKEIIQAAVDRVPQQEQLLVPPRLSVR